VGDSDVVLLHELVHAVRPTQVPLLKARPTNDDWGDHEEFFANMVENIYRSERGDPDLKGQLGSVSHRVVRLNTLKFLKDGTIRARIEQAYAREDLAKKLARHAEIAFNPFALIGAAAP
jgi:hypothetical protein